MVSISSNDYTLLDTIRFELDTWYVENRSLWLDFKIMLKTVQKVLSKDDISAEGEATMSKFTGTSEPKDD
jgi:lipopolysaccharide/colanic/teichoic acid biosynthesis glycosyltransferase